MSTLPIYSSPRYVKIAGEYNVSPETIRRSVFLLQNMKVVEVK
ncbi:MAG: hypothetical protein WDA24_04205 [Tissierellales bacterium]